MNYKLFVLAIGIVLLVGAVSADTAIFSVSNTNQDGRVVRTTDGTYAAIRGGNGELTDITVYDNVAYLESSTTSGQYTEMGRGVQRFNTSTLPDSITVSSAKLCTIGVIKENGLGSFGYVVTGFTTPDATGNIGNSNYQNYTEAWSDALAYASIDVSGSGYKNNWSLNDLGKTNISPTGWTNLMIRDTPDVTNNATLVTWSSAKVSSYYYGDIGDYGAVKLEVIYTTGSPAPVASFTQDHTLVRMPHPVVMTDTSTNTPTSWQWSWGDGTANSTTQNPTHTYTKRGKFTINMAAINAGGTGVATASTVMVVGYENYY
jgi:hypothetical protein